MPRGNQVDDFNKEFFPITKVFLGNKMDIKQEKRLLKYVIVKTFLTLGLQES